MEPKTKLQKRVATLAIGVPELKFEQRKMALGNCLGHVGYRTKKHTTCMDCGHVFQSLEHYEWCPKCNIRLVINDTKKLRYEAKGHFCIIDKFREFQVVRYFLVEKRCKIGTPTEYEVTEVVQHWISPDGKITVRAMLINSMNSQIILHWSRTSNLEIREYRSYHDIYPDSIWPQMKTIPELKRNGFKKVFHRISPHGLFSVLLSDPRAETLFKSNQIAMFKYFFCNPRINIDLYWPSIKILLRSGYILDDVDLWTDHIKTLEYLGKDTLNAKYVCPDNLKLEHNRCTQKIREIERKKALEEQKEKIEKEQKIYEKKKKKFFDIKISDGNIEIVVLDHIGEFAVEGDVLKHCVFTNEYYKKPESLILSARKGSERLETIEVDLKQLEVVQSRGLQNQSSEYHDLIVNLVNNNMSQIRKRKRMKVVAC